MAKQNDYSDKVFKQARLNELTGIVGKLSVSARELLLDLLGTEITEGKKQQVLAQLRSESADTLQNVSRWLDDSIAGAYTHGMNLAEKIGSTAITPSDGLPLYKWVGGDKGALNEAVNATFGNPTVGKGIYYALDPQSSQMFGDTLQAYVAPKTVKLYDSTKGLEAGANAINEISNDKLFREMLLQGKTEDLIKYAKTKGYDGVIFRSDDGESKWVGIDEKVAKKVVTPVITTTQKVTVTALRTDSGLAPHLRSVNILLSDAYTDFANGFQGFTKGAERIINEATRKQLQETIGVGRLEGSAVREIKKDLVSNLTDRGFSALISKNGRQWELDTYSEMLARTHLIRANNEAITNRMRENDIDIVEVSDHNTTTPLCQKYEGKIFSLTGRSKKYKQLDMQPPFHPNCKHTLYPRPDLQIDEAVENQ